MQALNSAERSSSILTFTAVYILILAIPLYLVYMIGQRSKNNSNTEIPAEHKAFAESLVNLQSYIQAMKDRDENQATGSGTASLWQSWVADAKKENADFGRAIEIFKNSTQTTTRIPIRNSIVVYLERLVLERSTRISLEESVHGVRNETSELQRLNMENAQLKANAASLQNTINLKDQMIADLQKRGGGSNNGGSANTDAVASLKWELLFCDANSTKSQADILSPCNQIPKRKQLYSIAKVNFQKITSGSVPSYTLKKLAGDKVREIDQMMAKL